MSILAEIIVMATVYHAVASQCNTDYLVTASGAKIESTETAHQHRYIALSRDLLKEHPYGSIAVINGCSVEEYNGVYVVADTMNKRWSNRVDILVSPNMPMVNDSVTVRFIHNRK